MYLGFMNWAEYAARQRAPQRAARYSNFTPRSVYSRAAAQSRYPYIGAPVQTTAPQPGSQFRYTSYWPKLHGVQLSEGIGAISPSMIASGAAAGSTLGPIGTAVGALIGGAAGIFGGKAPGMSRYGFQTDDWPLQIVANQQQIEQLQDAINKINGTPIVSHPTYSVQHRAPWQQNMVAMKLIVPLYVPGQEQNMVNNNGSLGQPGGAYERTYQAQISLIPQLQQQLQQLQIKAQSVPVSGSATAVAPYSGPASPALTAPSFQTPQYYAPAPMPQFQPGPTMQPAPSNISITSPGQTTADMFGGATLQGMLPYIIGGVGLFAILMMQGKSDTRTVYRSVPRRRK